MLYVVYDSEDLFFRPGQYVSDMTEAQAFADANNWRIHSVSDAPKKWITDGSGFKPHFNQGLGMYVESKGQYYSELKKRKLVEVGNERVHAQTQPKRKGYLNDSVIRGINEMGAGLSDSEVRQLRAEVDG